MAIPFLNNITLNNNEIQNVRLQNGGNPPLSSGPGQIYFDTSAGDETAKYYSNITDEFVSLKEYSFPAGSFVTGTITGTTPKPIITFDLSASGTPDATVYLRGDNAWEPISAIPGTYTWTVSDGTNSTAVASGETVTFSGTANEIEVAEASRTVTIGLPDDVTITNDLTVSGAGDFTGQVTIPILPVASTDAASKDYVDNAVVGGLVYQGGYDANLNSPDLTTSPNSILKGWTYTVIADGTFFGEQLRVGDVLIAEINDPSALTDWTTVQNNIDLASLTQVGIGNVNASILDDELGIEVAYAAGTAKVGLDIDGLALDALAEQPSDYFLPIYDAGSGINNKAKLSDLLAFANSVTSFSGIIGNGSATSIRLEDSGAVAPNINHGLGTDSSSFMIQLVDVSSGETVYADVTRGAGGQVTINFAAAPAVNDIRVLIQKIG
jgi:hypothetical protein